MWMHEWSASACGFGATAFASVRSHPPWTRRLACRAEAPRASGERRLVEAAGIEPASQGAADRISTCVVDRLNLAPRQPVDRHPERHLVRLANPDRETGKASPHKVVIRSPRAGVQLTSLR